MVKKLDVIKIYDIAESGNTVNHYRPTKPFGNSKNILRIFSVQYSYYLRNITLLET